MIIESQIEDCPVHIQQNGVQPNQSTLVTDREEATVSGIGCYPMWMNDTHYSGNPALDGMLRDTACLFSVCSTRSGC